MATELTVPHAIDWTRGVIKEQWPKEGGFSATVAYRVLYADRFQFYRELRGGYFGGSGFNQYTPPFAYPPNPICYCQEVACEPLGDVNRTNPSKYSPYEHALVTATFRVPDLLNTPEQAANPTWVQRTQIDPTFPIIGCRQRIRAQANYRTYRQAQLLLTRVPLANEIIEVDDGVPENRVIFELEFPRVFFHPFQYLKPYLGRVNSVPIFGLPAEHVLLQGFDLDYTSGPDGLELAVTLQFEGQLDLSWNQRYDRAGVVRNARFVEDTARKPIEASNHREIFA
jgi:hypothetical protein